MKIPIMGAKREPPSPVKDGPGTNPLATVRCIRVEAHTDEVVDVPAECFRSVIDQKHRRTEHERDHEQGHEEVHIERRHASNAALDTQSCGGSESDCEADGHQYRPDITDLNAVVVRESTEELSDDEPE